MTKNVILIPYISLTDSIDLEQAHGQGFLETLVKEKYPWLRTHCISSVEGIGEYLSEFVPVRFDKFPPTSIEELHTKNESSIINDVKAIVLPINEDGCAFNEQGLYNLPNIKHVSSLLNEFVQREKQRGSWHSAFYDAQKAFSNIFDIHHYFAAGSFIPNLMQNTGGVELKTYTNKGPMLPEQDLATWMPVVEKAYDVWLSTIK